MLSCDTHTHTHSQVLSSFYLALCLSLFHSSILSLSSSLPLVLQVCLNWAWISFLLILSPVWRIWLKNRSQSRQRSRSHWVACWDRRQRCKDASNCVHARRREIIRWWRRQQQQHHHHCWMLQLQQRKSYLSLCSRRRHRRLRCCCNSARVQQRRWRAMLSSATMANCSVHSAPMRIRVSRHWSGTLNSSAACWRISTARSAMRALSAKIHWIVIARSRSTLPNICVRISLSLSLDFNIPNIVLSLSL